VTVTDYAYQVTNANGTYWVLASGHAVLNASGTVIQYPTLTQIYAQVSSTGTWTTMTGAELNFAERYSGDAITIDNNPADPSQSLSVLGPELTAAWNALNLETVRLAMQGPLAPYFAGLTYDTASDTFDVTTNQQLAPMFTAIFAGGPASVAGATAWIASWKPILDVIEGNLAPSQGLTATYGYLFASMVAAYEATSMPISIASVAVALGIPASHGRCKHCVCLRRQPDDHWQRGTRQRYLRQPFRQRCHQQPEYEPGPGYSLVRDAQSVANHGIAKRRRSDPDR
jgi:hypothetical protein